MGIDLKLIKFFVEGDGDKVLVRDLLKIWYGIELNKEQLRELIIICKGYNQLDKQIDEFRQIEVGQKRDGGANIIVFDADYTGREEDHGYAKKNRIFREEKNRIGD